MHHFEKSDSKQAAFAFAGTVARELLTLRSLAEVEETALRAIAKCTDASWSALYRPSDRGYRRGSVCGSPVPELPERLETAAVQAVLKSGNAIQSWGQELEKRLVPQAVLRAGLACEFDIHPALLLVGESASGAYTEAEVEKAGILVEVCSDALRNAELIERLRSQVFVDFITGCYNRRAFEEHLNVELVRARRYERPLTMLLLDLDDFKQVNDDLGHPTGDYALQRVGETLRNAFRTTDRICRYGGDEFAVIFPETPKEEVVRLAERIRRQIAGLFPDTVNVLPITASIGIAGYPHDGTRADDLVRAADRALYGAKSGGRNQVVAA